MVRRLSLLMCAPILVLACTDRVGQVVAPPPDEDMRAMILVLVSDDGVQGVQAVSLDRPGWTAAVPLADEGDNTFYALMYRCPLSAMGLWEGALPLGELRPLPPSSALYAGRLVTEDNLQWQALQERPPVVADLKIGIPAPDLCARLEATTVVIPDTDSRSIHMLLPLDADTALVGLGDGRVYRVTKDGGADRLPYGGAAEALLAGFDRGQGERWFARRDGCFARGQGEAEPAAVACGPEDRGRSWMWLDGAPSHAPFELFLVTQDGTFERFDGDAVETLFTHPDPNANVSNSIAALWLEPGRAMAAGIVSGIVHVYDNGRVEEELYPLDLGDLDGGISLGRSVAHGVLMGTLFGNILHRRSGTWVLLGSPVRVPIRLILPMDDGVLVGGGNGAFSELRADGSSCPPISLSGDDVRRGVAVGDRSYILTSRADRDLESSVIFAERTDERSACSEGGL